LDAVSRAEQLTDLRERYRESVHRATRGAATRLVDYIFERPVLNARLVELRLDLSRPAALQTLRLLANLGMLDEMPDGPRGQLRWRAPEVMRILTAEPTEPDED
jgi:Fic family protein